MTLTPLEFGPGGAYRFSSNAGRSLTSEAVGAIKYPSPFFDIAHTYLPSTFKSMLRWCRYYFLTNPLINAVVYKMAAYPITDLVIDEENDALRSKWEYLFEDVFRFKQFEAEADLDYNAYGNTFISMFFPFHKYLVCKSCKYPHRAERQKYTFRDFKFVGKCKRCGHYGPFKPVDHYVKSVRDIRLIRWNPEHITIQHNEATGESRYYYTVPATLANDIRLGKRGIIERIPQIFIEALRVNKAILFNNNNLYHMKRPTIAQKDKGWGLPMILPVLKDTFYLQILRKAQEAIAIEHIVPLRLIAPMSGSSTADVYSGVNLQKWRGRVEQELMRWRLDNNYIPIMPIPVAQQTLGGDGRALMLAQEYRVWAEHIVSGMGVPIEFVFGGMQYCMDLNSYVFTDKGMVKLRELVPAREGSVKLEGVHSPTHLGAKEVAFGHHVGTKKVAHIKTRLGLQANPSYDHGYLVLNKDLSTTWKKTDELEPGDHIAVKPGSDTWSSSPFDVGPAALEADTVSKGRGKDVDGRYPCEIPAAMSEELSRVIGYLISEGACISESRLGFSQKDPEVMEDFLNCVEAVFGYRPNSWGVDTLATEIARRPAVGFLRTLGVKGDSFEKSIPECILRSPYRFVRQFLRAYFEGDGSAPDVAEKQTVSCFSKSDELVRELQLVLLNAGVVSSRYVGSGGSTLHIRSEFVDLFSEKVGFVSSRKAGSLSRRTPTAKTHIGERIPYLKEALDKFRAQYFDNRSSWTFEAVPATLDKEEYTVKEVAGILGVDVTTVYYHIKKDRLSYSRTVDTGLGRFPTRLVSREGLGSFLTNFGRGVRKTVPGRDAYGMTYSKLSASDLSTIKEKDPGLFEKVASLSEYRYVWDTVEEVDLYEYEVEMGDLTVHDDHSYVADGLVCHNSGSNVSLRMLENHFLDQKGGHLRFVKNFIIPNVSAYMGWPAVEAHFKKFKMADDLQRSAFHLQMNQAGKLSNRSLLEDTDWNVEQERERIENERDKDLESQRKQALGQASIQGEAQLVMQRYQLRGQKALMEAQAGPMGPEITQEMAAMGQQAAGQPGQASPMTMGDMVLSEQGMMNRAGMIPPMPLGTQEEQEQEMAGPPQQQGGAPQQGGAVPAEAQSPMAAGQGGNIGIMDVVNRIVGWLDSMPDNQKQAELANIRQANPQIYSLVVQALNSRQGAHANSASMAQPEQKPPRRGPEAVTV